MTRAVSAMLMSAVVGGPFSLLLMALLPISRGTHDLSEKLLTASLWSSLDLALSLLAGALMCAFPAAMTILLAVESFAQYRRDSWMVAALSGVSIGLTLLALTFAFVFYGPVASNEIPVATGASGAIMGLLYWVIAIRPRRNFRLLQEQSA